MLSYFYFKINRLLDTGHQTEVIMSVLILFLVLSFSSKLYNFITSHLFLTSVTNGLFYGNKFSLIDQPASYNYAKRAAQNADHVGGARNPTKLLFYSLNK